MIFKICKITLLFFIINSLPSFAQQTDEYQKQKEEFEKKMQVELDERIQKFVTQLQVDDFQKEIIKQKLHSYYREQKAIYTDVSLKYFERNEKLSILDTTHFDDIKNMISEDTLNQIQVFVKDVGSTLEKQKKKKKKNKKTNNE